MKLLVVNDFVPSKFFVLQAELHDVSKEMELDLLKQYLQVCTSGSSNS
jgi:hypothetical protein